MKKSKKKTISGIIASILIIAYAVFYTISLINNIQTAKVDVEKQNAKIEETGASTTYQRLADVVKVGDYVNYTPDSASSYSLPTTVSGYSSNQTIWQDTFSWRVMSVDKSTGKVEIVSNKPTNDKIGLDNSLGYNNGVFVLNDICKKQYSNSSLGAVARSLNVNDVEAKLTSAGQTSRNSQIGSTHTYTVNTYYPVLYAQEVGSGINSTSVKTSGIGRSDNYYSSTTGSKYANASKLTIKVTGYTLQYDDNCYDSTFNSLVMNMNSSFFLASRGVEDIPGSAGADFGLYYVNSSGRLAFSTMFNSLEPDTGGTMFDCNPSGIRPVVTLNADTYISNEGEIVKGKVATGIEIGCAERVAKGNTVKANILYTPTDANIGTDVTWTSSNPSILTIDQEGNMTGIKADEYGETSTITATTANGLTATKTIRVVVINLSETSGTAYLGGSDLKTYLAGNYNSTNLIIQSSNSNIATASRDGRWVTITPKAVGTATITLIDTTCGAQATYTVTVKEPTINLSSTSGTAYVGGSNLTATITGEGMGALSVQNNSNSNVAGASISGSTLTITPKAAGTATITVKEGNGNKTATYTVTVRQTSINLSSTSGTAYVGGSNLTSTISGNYMGALSVQSNSNSNVAGASISGNTLTITPKTAGTATITVKEGNGNKTVTYTVTVRQTSINLSSTSGIAYVGGSNLTSTISGNYMGALSVQSNSNSNVAGASISGNTLTITPKAAGTSTITVKEGNGNKTATYTVTVKETSIKLNNDKGYVREGGKIETGINGDNMGELTLTNSDSNIATATIKNKQLSIEGKNAGIATITVKEGNGNKTATYTATVTSLSISPTKSTIDVTKNNTVKIQATKKYAGTITWTSSNPEIASISTVAEETALTDEMITKRCAKTATRAISDQENLKLATVGDSIIGDEIVVTAVSNGTTTITAVGENGEPVATSEIKVQTSPLTLNISGTRYIAKEDTSEYFVTFSPETTSTELIKWTVGDEEIAQIVETDREYMQLKALKEGETTITAKVEDGISNTMRIKVTNLTLNPEEATIDLSQENKLTITSEGTDVGEVTWTVDNKEVVSLDKTKGESIELTGLKNGTAVITAIGKNGGPVATSKITVQTSPSKVELDKQKITLDTTDKKEESLTATISPETVNVNSNLNWTSSNEQVAIVDEMGKVTAVSNGTSTITVETENGKTATCEVEVTTSPSEIQINQENVILDINGKNEEQLTVTISPSEVNANTNLTWTSSNNEIVAVDETGKVTGVSNGTATITVETENEQIATCEVKVQTSPSRVDLDKQKITLDTTDKKEEDLTATISPETANVNTNITWTSSDENIVRVENISNEEIDNTENNEAIDTPVDGLSEDETIDTPVNETEETKPLESKIKVIGISNGTATITVETENGKTATCEVEVTTSPSEIQINQEKVILDINGKNEEQLTATISPSEVNTNTNITWTSSDNKVATVDETGKVTAVGNGTAIITATTENGKIATCEVEVQTSAKTLNIVGTRYIAKGDTSTYFVAYAPQTTTIELVNWSVEDGEILQIVETDRDHIQLKALKEGETTLTAKIENGISSTMNIKVTKLTINPEKATIDLGEEGKTTITSEGVNVGEITWQVDNKEIISLDKTKGESVEVIGLQNGTATVTAKGENGNLVAKANITVQTSPSEIILNKTSEVLYINGKSEEQLTAKILPETANVNTSLIWTSSDENVVTVDQEGNVKAVANGTADITVTTENGKTATCNITVKTGTQSIEMNAQELILDINGKNEEQITVKILPETEDIGLTWTSSNEDVVTVDDTGKITAVGNGTAVITVTTEDGKTVTCNVTIQTSPSGIIMSKENILLDISIKPEEQLTATITPETANANTKITWVSSDENIATVDETGNVIAVSNGTAVIKATTQNGKEVTSKITVITTKNEKEVDMSKDKEIDLKDILEKEGIDTSKIVKWESSDETIATVDENGKVTGIKNGTVTITATLEDGTKIEYKITITGIPEKPTTPGIGDTNDPGGNNQGTSDSNNPSGNQSGSQGTNNQGGNQNGNQGTNNQEGSNQGGSNQGNNGGNGVTEEGWLLGDINLDKKVDVTDLLLLKRHLVSGNKKAWVLTKEEQNRGNMDRNKTVDITDLLLLKRELVK